MLGSTSLEFLQAILGPVRVGAIVSRTTSLPVRVTDGPLIDGFIEEIVRL
jgi:hypothetical protein